MQQQRYFERGIRRWKREYLTAEEMGQDTTEAAVRLKAWREREADFLKQTGRRQDSSRSQLGGFGHSQASKATWAAKKEIEKYSKIRYNANGTIVVTDDWKSKGKVTIPRKYKSNAVIETQTEYKNGTIQVDRTIYDSSGIMFKQIHSGPHNRPDKHPYGKSGEHAHDYTWKEDGSLDSKKDRDLNESERIQHADILR